MSAPLLHAPVSLPRRKSSLHTLDRRMGGTPQTILGCGDEHLLLPGIELQFLGRPAHNLVALWINLSRLGTSPYGEGGKYEQIP